MRHSQDLDFEEAIQDNFAGDSGYLELPLSRQVFFLVTAIGALLIAIALGRVFYFAVLRGGFYESRAESNIHREVILPSLRGVITDRYGEVLVKNTSSFSVFINLPQVLQSQRNLEKILADLSSILAVDYQELKANVGQADLENRNSVLAAKNISPDQAIAIKSADLPGVLVEDDYVRQYINGPAFAHVVGYDSASVKTGLEAAYDRQLEGKDGLSLIFEDAKGNALGTKTVSEPIAGQPLVTTLDAGLQQFFYQRLRSAINSLGASGGVGIALDPRNGEVLALTNVPSFDNNFFVSSGHSPEKTRLLNAPLRPLFNRAVSGAYNPGSTIKPLVALAALKEGIVMPDTEIFSRGWIEIPNPYNPDQPSRFVDWKPHGWVDLRSALARSSNVYFYALGGGLPPSEASIVQGSFQMKGLGVNKLRDYWLKFGLDKKTGIDISSENSGFLPEPDEKEKRTGQIWRLGDTYNVSIGQGDLSVTPIRLLSFIASIANGGKIYQPHLVVNSSAETLLDYSDWVSELKEVRQGMEDAVTKSYGTAHMLASLPISAAAKTGSAQVENNRKTNAFFVGYANADNPEIAILVLIENAREGSLNAVPIANDVLRWYYDNRLATSS